MKLFGTAPSPFTRKVRIVLAESGNRYEFVPLTQIQETGSEKFAGNPLHMYPVLELDDGRRIFDSAAICDWLLAGAAPETLDRRQVQVVINGVIDAGVKIIRARRSEIPDFDRYVMFRQERAAIQEGLCWLEKKAQAGAFAGPFSLLQINLLCLMDWAEFRELVPGYQDYPALQGVRTEWKDRPSVAQTHPARELPRV